MSTGAGARVDEPTEPSVTGNVLLPFDAEGIPSLLTNKYPCSAPRIDTDAQDLRIGDPSILPIRIE